MTRHDCLFKTRLGFVLIFFPSLVFLGLGCDSNSSVSLYKVSQWLGHADFKTTQIYAHLAPQDDEIGAFGVTNVSKPNPAE